MSQIITCKFCGEKHHFRNGNPLRIKRMRAGVGLREFARQVGFSAQYLSLIETGTRNASPEIIKLYEQLGERV